MRIVIAGTGGLVGREFARQFCATHEVVALEHRDLDITDRQRVKQLIVGERPALVINCAVLGVDACERDPSQAWKVNVEGTENLAQAASDIDAEFLYLSTNYVFDGKRVDDLPYTNQDVPASVNIYGQTKLAGERAAMLACQRTFIVRTSWIFGAGKKNFLSAIPEKLGSRKRIQAITDISASSTYVRDLVVRIDALLMHHRYGTYHVTNSGFCSYYDFALEAARMLKMSNPEISTLIEPVKAAQVQLLAPRPRYTPMRCVVSEEIGLPQMRHWHTSLADYLKELGMTYP
jgi:dTDP-4-dehydrorhamnose reductase